MFAELCTKKIKLALKERSRINTDQTTDICVRPGSIFRETYLRKQGICI